MLNPELGRAAIKAAKAISKTRNKARKRAAVRNWALATISWMNSSDRHMTSVR